MPLDPRRVKELFAAALELPDAEARQALLDSECGGDAELRQRLDVLLAAHDVPARRVEPAAAWPRRPTPPLPTNCSGTTPADVVGSVIAGKYKLLQEIGEGGMGSVFMADQTHPVKRRVAVKVIKAGHGLGSRAGPVRGRAAGAGPDGPPAHRQGARRRHDRDRSAVLRHGTGQGHPAHRVLRRAQAARCSTG